MLRIEQHEDRIVIQAWKGVGAQPITNSRTYPATADNLAWLKRHIASASQQGRVTTYLRDATRPFTIFLVYRKRHYTITGSGTYYDERTRPAVIQVLEWLRDDSNASRRYGDHKPLRVKITYGDMFTGRVWGDGRADETGHIGRTMGLVKAPMILHNARSIGGSCLMTEHIVKIEYARKQDGGAIWTHPLYHIVAPEAVEGTSVPE